MVEPSADGPTSSGGPSLDSTAYLIRSAREGDAAARERLFARFLPIITQWARHRLPGWARSLAETDDLVQTTLMRALNRLPEFEDRGAGAFLGYLRHILLNAVRDEVRRASSRHSRVSLDELSMLPDPTPSPLERTVGLQTMAHYEQGLARLTPAQREAVILRIEMGLGYAEIAELLDKPTPAAARMTVARALVQLAESMDVEESTPES